MTPHSLSSIARAFHNVECPPIMLTTLPPERPLPRSIVFVLGALAGLLLAFAVFLFTR
jgi:hypothetical protein